MNKLALFVMLLLAGCQTRQLKSAKLASSESQSPALVLKASALSSSQALDTSTNLAAWETIMTFSVAPSSVVIIDVKPDVARFYRLRPLP